MKRAFDLALVLLSAPLWLPLLAVVAFLVRARLGSPVFFWQPRPGLHGELFDLVKFRTMTAARHASGALRPDAERLTPFGRWLRASSLDELPEFLNVLRGEMSLVGPRPLMPQYLGRYTERQARRHEVLPGITGLAQVMGRNALSWDEKFEWDIRYVERRSVALDLKILCHTVLIVARRDGIAAAGDATMPEFNPAGRRPAPSGSHGLDSTPPR